MAATSASAGVTSGGGLDEDGDDPLERAAMGGNDDDPIDDEEEDDEDNGGEDGGYGGLGDDYDDEQEDVAPGHAERWPKLTAEPRGAHEPIALGARPRHTEGSIYPAAAEVNANVAQHLREYQKEGVRWLWGQYERGDGGLLGDEMGLGKTVQLAAFLSAVLGKSATADDKERVFPLGKGDCRMALIVCPKAVLSNWARELATWGYFRVQTAHGADKASALRAARERECEVLLTTYDTLRNCLADFCEVRWEVTVWDEAHLMKNERTKNASAARAIACGRRYALTGTPMANDFRELWSLFDFVSGARVGSQADFKAYYTTPLQNGFKKNAKQWEIYKRLMTQKQIKALMDRWMLQRFKSIIADQMPLKRDNIVFCRLAPEQEEVYMRVLESSDYKKLYEYEDPCSCGSGLMTKECCPIDPHEPGIVARWFHPELAPCSRCPSCIMMPCMTQLAKIANHLELVKPDESMAEDARLRQEEFARMALGGGHDAPIVRDRRFFSQSHATSCGKMRALQRLLRAWKARSAKVLLFSYSTQMLDILQDFVDREGYVNLRLDGSTSTSQRTTRVAAFNTNPNVFIFLLSTKAGGLGINLVAANKVVVFDPNWNPSWDMQAQDRAYRIGQRQDVDVYRFIASNTIEEKVYQRQLYKQGQEGLALHQRDETRYFDGVQGDKRQKGELFGMKNLLTFARSDASRLTSSGTRDILAGGRNALDRDASGGGGGGGGTVSHEGAEGEGDAFWIHQGAAARGTPGDGGDDGAAAAAAAATAAVPRGERRRRRGGRPRRRGRHRWLLDKVEPGRAARKRTRGGGGGEEQERGEAAEGRHGPADESEILRRSGAVHSHLNSNVLGGAKLRTNGKQPMAPPPPPHAPRPAAAAAAAAGSAAQSSAAADAAPSAASKRQKSPLMTPPPTTPPRDLAECLSGATTYAEYTSRLQTDPAVAYRAVYARIAWGEETLLRAVNALP